MASLYRSRISSLVVLGLLVATGGAWAGQSRASHPSARHQDGGPKPPEAEFVVDVVSGRVLWSRDADLAIHPASLTKVMTLELLFDALSKGTLAPATRIVISEAAAARPRTRLGVAAGDSVSVAEAALCLAVHSCNDVATAVAEAIGGNEAAFAVTMTETAKKMGLRHTHFANASGLPDPGNVTTARDLALLGATFMAKNPTLWRVLSVPSWSFRDQTFSNTNTLLSTYPGMEGGKTGYVRESGFNLLAVASRGGRRVLAVVAGGRTARERDLRMKDLLDAALDPAQAGSSPR